MRKDLKKRLEKAIITLKEPGGSTIRSIIKVINKEGPILSLRKVLEALQEGINEGFLCMYNGRVKLKQQMKNDQSAAESADRRNKRDEDASDNDFDGSESENEDSDFLSEEEDEMRFPSMERLATKKNSQREYELREKLKQAANRRRSEKSGSRKYGQVHKKTKRRQRREDHKGGFRNLNLDKTECDSILEITPSMPEKKYGRPAAERPDLKKQRGPRCTSMKKDIRMPSKVHLPFVLPSAPQKTNIFNDLLRRSPEPVNGPLFDSFMLTAENVSFC